MICHYFAEPSYLIFSADVPAILYYSHLPAMVIGLLVGTFVYSNGRQFLLNKLLFGISLAFTLWTLANLVAWTNIHSDIILFFWTLFGPMAALIAIFSVYFTYVFVQENEVSVRIRLLFIALLTPVFLISPTKYGLAGFNISDCDSFGFIGTAYETYYYGLGLLAIVWILYILISRYKKAGAAMRRQITLLGTGIILFLALFFGFGFLASYLTGIGLLEDSDIELYGLFGMVFFMVYIGVVIVKFERFHVGVIAAQALVVALVSLIASQLTFADTRLDVILTSITLIIVTVVGVILVRSVKREIEQRRRIELLADELNQANKRQTSLIRFITHQLKGFVSKSRNIFSMIGEEDFGPVPEQMRPIIEEGFRETSKGAQTIQEILNAANIKSGKVAYANDPYDFAELVKSVVGMLKPNADAKQLALTVAGTDTSLTIRGDRMQMENAVKNLIDNSIKYTLAGSVAITLEHQNELVRLTVADTGVGITPDDMQNLFTEGGHGKESQKVNVDSTGFGLYIVKNIVEAHKGKVWAESEGEGKGAKFVVELPQSLEALAEK